VVDDGMLLKHCELSDFQHVLVDTGDGNKFLDPLFAPGGASVDLRVAVSLNCLLKACLEGK
jgi:hypothetical protein